MIRSATTMQATPVPTCKKCTCKRDPCEERAKLNGKAVLNNDISKLQKQWSQGANEKGFLRTSNGSLINAKSSSPYSMSLPKDNRKLNYLVHTHSLGTDSNEDVPSWQDIVAMAKFYNSGRMNSPCDFEFVIVRNDDAYALKITDEELARGFFKRSSDDIEKIYTASKSSIGGNEVAYFLNMLQGTGLSYFQKDRSQWNALKVTESTLPNVPSKTFYNTEKIDCNKKIK